MRTRVSTVSPKPRHRRVKIDLMIEDTPRAIFPRSPGWIGPSLNLTELLTVNIPSSFMLGHVCQREGTASTR